MNQARGAAKRDMFGTHEARTLSGRREVFVSGQLVREVSARGSSARIEGRTSGSDSGGVGFFCMKRQRLRLASRQDSSGEHQFFDSM